MIRREPGEAPVDALEVQRGYQRGHPDRPWLLGNFVATIDGATVVDGGSTAINDEDDMMMFHALRAVTDVIVVGAGTVRAENYGPVKFDTERRAARRDVGQAEVPRLVVISGSLGLDPDHRIFGDPSQRVTILTDDEAPEDRFVSLSQVADVVRLSSTGAREIVEYLGDEGILLCEGGASLMGHFVAARLLDEMALTISPLMVAGQSNRVAQGAGAKPPLQMRLDDLLFGDRCLLLRFVRDESAG